MYDFIAGELAAKSPTHAVIDAGGVGYMLRVPLSTFEALPDRGRVRLYTHLHVRDDALELFGFATALERSAFEKLLRVRGIGPGLAITVLSGLPVASLQEAVARGDVDALSRIKGIGRKTAERIILDLRDAFADLVPAASLSAADRRIKDAVAAMTALGYGRGEAERAVAKACERVGAGADVEVLVREALQG